MMFKDKSVEPICSMELGAYRQKILFLRKVLCTLNIQGMSIKEHSLWFFIGEKLV